MIGGRRFSNHISDNTNPKRQRGRQIIPSLALRVSMGCLIPGSVQYILLVAATFLAPVMAHGQDAENAPVFEQDIAPILKAHCHKCHSNQDAQGGLDLGTAASLMKGSDEGPVVLKGLAEKSVLLQKIAARQMPPPKEKDPLSDEQVTIIRKWIAAGAPSKDEPAEVSAATAPLFTDEDRKFWAFRPPVALSVPRTMASHLVRTPVDSFLLARQEAKGLTFSPETSRPTLLRRASLDLVGLPPSPEEIQAFLADTRPDAFERQIDRLLESPHYGERWGRHWLDVAGYTDAPHYTPDKAE